VATNPIDPILLSVYARTFKAITDEMSISMERTTRSPILCEAKDYVTGLYDAEGRMLEQTENLPILAFSLAPVCKHIRKTFDGDIHPATCSSTTTSSRWATRTTTSRCSSRCSSTVSWSAGRRSRATRPTSAATSRRLQPERGRGLAGGAAHPGGQGGRPRQAAPGRLEPDLRQHAAGHRAARHEGRDGRLRRRRAALVELLRKYGAASLEAHKQALFDATRRMMEAEIAKIPNGRYSGEGYVYYDGRHEGSKFTIRVDIEVRDKSIRFDYSRTDAQTNGFVNGTFTSSASATILTLLQMVNPDIPHNEGMVEPIEIVIPEGTILNAAYPKATTFGNHLCPPNADAIQRALARCCPTA
jgi:N-methylhydantoinase B